MKQVRKKLNLRMDLKINIHRYPLCLASKFSFDSMN